jgi:hypothetical protein
MEHEFDSIRAESRIMLVHDRGLVEDRILHATELEIAQN